MEALQNTTTVVEDLNATQLAQGLRADGSELLPSYTPLTIELKKHKSGLAAVTSHVTLFDTGDFYRSLHAEVKGDRLVYSDTDEKFEKLNKKFSTSKGSILGLTKDSKGELVNSFLRKEFLLQAHTQTGL